MVIVIIQVMFMLNTIRMLKPLPLMSLTHRHQNKIRIKTNLVGTFIFNLQTIINIL
jgi:hypothetical protein